LAGKLATEAYAVNQVKKIVEGKDFEQIEQIF
jgi:hypothetical protein